MQANGAGSDAPPTVAAPVPAQPERGWLGRLWHEVFSIPSQREKAEMLRRALGSASGQIFYRNGEPINVDGMSDEEIIAFAREIGNNRPSHLPPMIMGSTEPPRMTSWGWSHGQPYRKALDELRQPGTHETLNGQVPTVEEAKRMLKEIGVPEDMMRLDEAHPPEGISTHTKLHINYYVGTRRATIYVRRS